MQNDSAHFSNYSAPVAARRGGRSGLDRKGLSLTGGGGLIVGVIAGLILARTGSAGPAEVRASAMNGAAAIEQDHQRAPVTSVAETPEKSPIAEREPVGTGQAEGKEAARVAPVEAPVVQMAALRFRLIGETPDDLSIEVNGRPAVDGIELSLQDGPVPARIVARAKGFETFRKSVTVAASQDIEIELSKAPVKAATSTKKATSPTNKTIKKKAGDKKPKGPGGLIKL